MKKHWSCHSENPDVDMSALRDKKEVYLYGASGFADARWWTVSIVKGLRDILGWNVAFVDRNAEKQELGYKELPVISPEKLYTLDRARVIVVICVSARSQAEVIEQLQRKNFVTGRDLFTDSSFVTEIIPAFLSSEKGYNVDVYTEH